MRDLLISCGILTAILAVAGALGLLVMILIQIPNF